jgi:hypothetical protein
MITLAQALRAKNMLVTEISNLSNRLEEVAVQGATSKEYTQEDFKRLCDKIAEKRNNLLNLKLAIDAANHKSKETPTTVGGGKCVHELILRRGEIADTQGMYQALRSHVKNCLMPRHAYEGALTFVSQISLKELDSIIDAFQNLLNAIDIQISQLNATITVDYNLP